jgi:hypothetical protein
MSDEPTPDRGTARVGAGEILGLAPGLARLAFGAWARSAEWGARGSLKAGSRLVEAAVRGESATQLMEDARGQLIEGARRVLGVVDPEREQAFRERSEGAPPPDPRISLRERGAELLQRSADVNGGRRDMAHPAYARILDEIAPDEARILRLLFRSGPEPAVDVRTWRPLDVGSSMVAPGLSMIALKSGLLQPDRVHQYLNNLFRLGLVWFSREPLTDPASYQVLEAQPEVIQALAKAGRGKTVRRSIQLTPFGEDFCRTCIPEGTREFEAVIAPQGA